jgi:hypothetical protein
MRPGKGTGKLRLSLHVKNSTNILGSALKSQLIINAPNLAISRKMKIYQADGLHKVTY